MINENQNSNPNNSGLTDSAERKKRILFKSQRTTQDDFGRSENNPIMTSSVSSSQDYLNRLRTPDGQQFTWKKIDSKLIRSVFGVDFAVIDKYQLFLNNKAFMIIYICPCSYDDYYVPKGLTLLKNNGASKQNQTGTEIIENEKINEIMISMATQYFAVLNKNPENVKQTPSKQSEQTVYQETPGAKRSSQPKSLSYISHSNQAKETGSVSSQEKNNVIPSEENQPTPKKKKSRWGVFIIVLFVLIIAADMIYAFREDLGLTSKPSESVSSSSAKSPSYTATPRKATATPKRTVKPTSTPRPVAVANGKMFIVPSYECVCPFKVMSDPTSGTANYYIYMKYIGPPSYSTVSRMLKTNTKYPYETDIAFFVKSGSSVSIDVPIGNYEIYYASGTTFYGTKYLFGDHTSRTKADEIFTFYSDSEYYQGHSITLYKVPNGNLETSYVSEDDFPTR